jgi:uncharacterized membrane protein (UPF0127 family)
MKKKKTLLIEYNRKKIKVIVQDCNFLQKGIGLMFSERETAEILLFDFDLKQKIKIHSFFVFYDFLAVWLDDNYKVVDIKKVNPFKFCVSPKKECFKLVEIPINRKNKGIISKFFPKK